MGRETLGVALALAACGGFLDAFTYLGHGHVFANSMTGNVVLMGVFAAAGDWPQAGAHLRPICAFLMGVTVAQALRMPRFRRWFPEAQAAALMLEIVFLAIGGCFAADFGGAALVLGISFVAALQSTTFKRAGKWSYNSTMATGNLRTFAEGTLQTLTGTGDADSTESAKVFGLLCAAFFAGAIIGGVCTNAFHNHALWGVDLVLAGVWVRLFVV